MGEPRKFSKKEPFTGEEKNIFFSNNTYHGARLKQAIKDEENSTAILLILEQGKDFISQEEKKNAMRILDERQQLLDEDFSSIDNKGLTTESDQKRPRPGNRFSGFTNTSISSLSCPGSSTRSTSSTNNPTSSVSSFSYSSSSTSSIDSTSSIRSNFSNNSSTNSSGLIFNFLNISNPTIKQKEIILALTAYTERNDLNSFSSNFKKFYPNPDTTDLQCWMKIAIAHDAAEIIEYLHVKINENFLSDCFSDRPDETSTEEVSFLELARALKKSAAIKKLEQLGHTVHETNRDGPPSQPLMSTITALFTLPKLTQNAAKEAKQEESKWKCCRIT